MTPEPAPPFVQPRGGDLPQAERIRLNVSWLLKLRWAAAAGQSLTILAVAWGLRIELPWAPLATILACEVAANAALELWFRRTLRRAVLPAHAARGERLLAGVMLGDVLLLGGLLHCTGGAFNPFSVFYLVNLSLSAVLLRASRAWLLLAVSLVSYAALFRWHRPLPALDAPVALLAGWNGRPQGLPLFFPGLAAAFAGAATFIAYFTIRVTRERDRLEHELSRAQQRKAETDKLEALGTLAAGAAHELASPLSTIAVVVRELELQLSTGGSGPGALDDVRLVREELDRCRDILNRMAGRAGEIAGEELQRLMLAELAEEVLAGLRERSRVTLDLPPELGSLALQIPRIALGQSLRAIVQNALDASPPDAHVVFRWRQPDAAAVRCEIEDRGHGMPPDVLARAGDPFFTTKAPGQGMGLGLFLARRVVERLGGTVELASVAARGTTIAITLPVPRSGR